MKWLSAAAPMVGLAVCGVLLAYTAKATSTALIYYGVGTILLEVRVDSPLELTSVIARADVVAVAEKLLAEGLTPRRPDIRIASAPGNDSRTGEENTLTVVISVAVRQHASPPTLAAATAIDLYRPNNPGLLYYAPPEPMIASAGADELPGLLAIALEKQLRRAVIEPLTTRPIKH
jgi:hypothetical protein